MYVDILLLLVLVSFSDGIKNCSDDCSQALGMEDHRIGDSQIFGGTAYNNDYANYGSQNVRLHDSYGYRADPSVDAQLNMIVIYLEEDMVITAIGTQGYGESGVSEWVTKFNMFYQTADGIQRPVKDTNGKEMFFIGNTDSNTVKRNYFPIPVLTSSVCIIPLERHNNVGLRLELYGCKRGHYFIVWLMMKDTSFTVMYTDHSSNEYEDATAIITDEVNSVLSGTGGFLYAHIRELSPQTSSSFTTLVTAIVEIHCVKSSEQFLMAMLKAALKKEESIFEPDYFKLQYPKRCGCAPPKAELRLGKNLKSAEKVFRSKKFVRYPIYLEHSCPPTRELFYSWKISKIDTETGYFSPMQNYRNKNKLTLLLRFVGIGYVYVQCVVEIKGDSGSMTYDYGFINIVPDPLVARITDITHESESWTTIWLSAGNSYDAGRKSQGTLGLRFTWFCKLENETYPDSTEQVVDVAFGRKSSHTGCFGFGPGRLSSTNLVLKFNTTDMVKSKKYIFMLVVKKDIRNSSAEYEFDVRPEVVIFVRCFSNCGTKVSSQDKLQLEAFCQGKSCSKISSYTWSLYLTTNNFSISEVRNVRIQPQLEGKHVVIDDIPKLRDDTSKHLYYVVKAAVKLDDETAVEGNFSFVVNSPPKKLYPETSCHVNPLEGEAISTDFLITCWGWHDVDQPLTYLFRYRDEDGMVIIQTGPMYNVSTKLPIGDPANDYTLVLEALVGDSFKDFTTTQLLVKVRRPKSTDFNGKIVNQQLNNIRNSVKAGDADRATELAFILMSTVKSFNDETFDKKASAILQNMAGLNVKSIVHVTKVAAVVIWATENKETVPLMSQGNALTLLSEATNFMASEFASNSTHDAELAMNVTAVLLNSIGSLLQVSSRDASLGINNITRQASGRELTLKTLELARKVCEALSSIRQKDRRKIVVKSNFVDIIIFKEKTENFGGKKLKEEDTSVFIPESAREMLPNTGDSLSIQLIAFKANPYTWGTMASSIDSMVIDITLRNSHGMEIKIANLTKPIELYIPNNHKQEQSQQPPHLFLQPGVIQYHSLVIPSSEHLVSPRIKTVNDRRLAVYLGRGFKPTADNYSSMASLPDFSSCRNGRSNCSADPHSLKLINNEQGLYYIGISLVGIQNVSVARLRRSCTGTGRRKKRSCIQVKDPPTTPPPTPLIITPQYDVHTSENYTFSVTMGACLYWSEEEEKWSNRGCKVGPDSVSGRVHCLCNHLTSFGGDFFVAPNPIDFKKVWAEFGRLGETGNYVVLATVCSMLALYFIGLIFARRADRNDKLKVIAEFGLSDRQASEGHTYSISIQTGAWRNSGTTANVGMVLYGVDDVSKPIIIPHNYQHMTCFARGSVNTFTLSLEKSLGSLFKINVWHDNSGDSPSWFLLEIVVEDVQTKEKWHFIANQWLAVEKGHGEIELELRAASNDELLEFKNVLHSRAQIAVGDSHLWVSIFTKPPHNQFTRCQRLSCCVSIIFCAMVTGAMFYRFGAKATDVFHIGPLKISWTEIKIGIQSGLVAVPVNILIVTIFRNSKQTGDQASSVGCLPHFFIYIGWFLCVSAMLSSAAFTVFYSLTWGAETSNQWLVSMTFSLFEDILLIQPIKVLFFVCFLSIIIRKPLEIVQVHTSELHLPEGYALGVYEREARILQMEELQNARRRRKKELKAFRVIVEIIFFLVFILLFMIVCYGNRDSVRYGLTKSVHDIFKDFSEVNDRVSFWGWVKNSFVPGIYNTSWYNDLPFDYDEGFISNRENFVVGMPRLRQVRVLPEAPCEVQAHIERKLGIPRCLPFYSSDRHDTTPYNKPGWMPVDNITLSLGNQLDSLCPKPWQYLNAHDLNTKSIHGKMATYSGGGYVASLGYNSESALNVIGSLEQDNWIDDKTAAVLVEFTVFEPSTSLFSVLKYLYERYPTGGVITSSKVKTVTVYLPQGSNSYRSFYQVAQVLLTLVILAFATMEIVKAFRGARAYFKRFWSWVEITLLSFAFAAIAIMLYKEKFTREYVRNVRANPFDNWSTDQILLWSKVEDYLLACVMFIITLKTLRLVRFNPHIYQMRMTLKDSFTQLYSFSIVFLVIVLAFASFGYLAFGSSVIEYSSLIRAVSSLLQMLIGGKSSYYQLKVASESFLGPLFLFAYLIAALAIMLNVFLAILNHSYTISRENTASGGDDIDYADLFQYLWSCAKYLHYSIFLGKTRRNYYVNGRCRKALESERNSPKLASMDSLREVHYPRVSLEHADEMISEVLANLSRLFDNSVQSTTQYADMNQDSERSHCGSEVEFHSSCGSSLEGDLYRSSTASLYFNANQYQFDQLSSDISESAV